MKPFKWKYLLLTMSAVSEEVVEAGEKTLEVPFASQQLFERPSCLRKLFIVDF